MACSSCEERARLEATRPQTKRHEMSFQKNSRQSEQIQININEPVLKEENIFKQKFGRCRECMTSAAMCTVIFWALFIFVYMMRNSYTGYKSVPLIIFVGVIAAAFSIVFSTHMVAYFLHKTREKNMRDAENTV
jgi:hypothetical protein